MSNKIKNFLEKQYLNHIVKEVSKYQKKYGFDMDNDSTHNNEADAFKHTFASALVSMEEG